MLLGVRETQSAGLLGRLVSCRNRTKASAVVFFQPPLQCHQKEGRDCSGQAGREASRDSYHPGLQSPPWPPLQTRAEPHPGEEDPKTLFLYMQVNKHIFFTKVTSEFISVLLLRKILLCRTLFIGRRLFKSCCLPWLGFVH